MDEGQTRWGIPIELIKSARRSVEVKRVHQDAERGTLGRLDDPHRCAEIRNHCPWKKLEYRAQSILQSQVADRAPPIREPAEIGIKRGGNHVSGAELRAGRHEGLERDDVDLRRDPDE